MSQRMRASQFPVKSDSLLGQVLDGRYQICDRLARGGFGEIYLAKDIKRPQQPHCVVKQLKPMLENGLAGTEDAERLFTREAETLEKLGHHPQVPQLLAHFEVDGEFYLVQELIEGRSLSEELAEQRSTEEQTIQLLQEVLSILAFVHSQGMIHRDVKPENLIRRWSDQRLVLIDFGAVKPIQPGTPEQRQTIAISSQGYTPIEQLRGRPCPSSDLYALGMIAIQALTGLHPQEFEESLHLQESSWAQQAQISPALAAILVMMTRYQWKDRYQSAEDVLQDLRELDGSAAILQKGAYANAAVAAPSPASAGYTPTLIKTDVAPDPTTTAPQRQLPAQPSISKRSRKSAETFSRFATEVPDPAAERKANVVGVLKSAKTALTPKLLSALLGIGLIAAGGGVFAWLMVGFRSAPVSTEASVLPKQVEFLTDTLLARSPVYTLAFSGDGKTLVGGGAENTVELWDTQTNQTLQTFSDHFGAVSAVAASFDGQLLATGGADAKVNLWNLQTGELLRSLKDHHWAILSVAFSPDGQTLATSSNDNTIKLWNTQTGQLLHTFAGFKDAFLTVAISSDGLLIGGSADHTIKIWDMQTRKLLRTLRGHSDQVNSVAVSSNSAVLASGSADRTVKLWNMHTGDLLRSFDEHLDAVRAVAFSPDGQILVSGSTDRTARVWHIGSAESLQILRSHDNEIHAVAVSADGRTIATGSLDSTIKLWQIVKGELQ